MAYYDEQLQNLQEQMARMKQLDKTVGELRSQRTQLNSRASELEEIMLVEQEDVDRLEGRSLASYFYQLIGKKDERLDKERREAYEARVRWEAVDRELNALDQELIRYQNELRTLRGCDMQYAKVLREKTQAVKAAGGALGEEILQLEEQLAVLNSRHKELREAVSAGSVALHTAESVLSSLESAESWGTWDLLGGGMISDMAKHGHLDEAQGKIETLQSQLRRFKTELADVTMDADVQVNVDGFLRFADYFFDGLFADWAVMDKIQNSKGQIRSTVSKIQSAMSRLKTMSSSVERQEKQIKEKLDRLVRETPL